MDKNDEKYLISGVEKVINLTNDVKKLKTLIIVSNVVLVVGFITTTLLLLRR
jgi:hypothetical protein